MSNNQDCDNFSFPGLKIAVDNFSDKLGLKALPVGDLWGSAMIVTASHRLLTVAADSYAQSCDILPANSSRLGASCS